jgi:hypothetical protein
MTISYDDPYNLIESNAFRASIGFLLKNYDAKVLEHFRDILKY